MNVNHLGDQHGKQKEEYETKSLDTEKDHVFFAEFTSKNGWDDDQIDKFWSWQLPKLLR